MNRFLSIILIIILVGLAGFIVLGSVRLNKGFVSENKGTQTSSLIKASSGLNAINSTITLFAVGDIMLDRGVEYMVEKKGSSSDFRFPFLKIADYLQKSDILFGNLESVISNKGIKVGSIYSFRAEPEAISGLTYAGFDILSVANNHIFDYGRKAMEDSLKRLEEAGINYVGGGFNEKEVRAGITKVIKGVKITFLAYTDKGSEYWQATKNRSGIGWLDKRIEGDIKKAKEKSDLVIVSFHWGEEYQRQPNRGQEYFGRLAIDSGADLVVGHHPHVVQPVERYKNGWIAYSLGNFVFDQKFSNPTMEGLLLEVLIKNKKIKKVRFKKIRISDNFQPYVAAFP